MTFMLGKPKCLQHAEDEGAHVLLTVATLATLIESEALLWEASLGRVQLEWPEEVVGLLEGWADGVDLVNKVLKAVDAMLAESCLDIIVAVEGDALGLSSGLLFAESTLVDELTGGLEGWISVGNVWLNTLDHLLGGLVDTEEYAKVDLAETEKLEDLLGLWVHVAHTADADHEHELGLWLAEVVACCLCLAALANK